MINTTYVILYVLDKYNYYYFKKTNVIVKQHL